MLRPLSSSSSGEYLNHSDRFRLAAIAQLPFVLTATARGASHRDDDFVSAAVVDRGERSSEESLSSNCGAAEGCADIPCTTAAVDDASGNGHVEVLQWWRQRWREREQPPPEIPIRDTHSSRHVWGRSGNVMEWWRRSGLRVLCSDRLLDMLDFNPVTVSWHRSAENELEIHKDGLLGATRNGHLRVLLWWQQTLKSNFPRKIPGIMDEVSKTGRLEMLEFWRRSGVKLSYTSEAVDGASERGDLQVLQWWAASGLKVLYSEKAMDRASANHHLHVLNWWSSSRFHPGVQHQRHGFSKR
ncbi:hypothetical protein DFJ73DRAFT_919955 [Zopfochytrium polystomum]|nr:hypothetical protein DFJ73DRAFT_919955 [Zopfochytrium polystomum]